MDAAYIVGTGKNVGKTVAMRAIAHAAAECGLRLGLTSIGRDGEAVDISDAQSKPRLFLHPPAVVATARNLLPTHPASEVLDVTPWTSASGRIVLARVRQAAYYELAGPAAASSVRACVEQMRALDCNQVIVDGALDRVAAIAGARAAIVVSVGASAARTLEEAVADITALVARLRIPRFDEAQPALHIAGALTASAAAQLYAAGERRQIVVRDPTQVAITGKSLLGTLKRLDLRCERPLRVVAATVASIGRDRYFEPRAFAQSVAQATALPVFDVYAGTRVQAA